MKSFFRRQKKNLIVMGVIFLLLVAAAIFLHLYNKYSGHEILNLWFEVIIISLLINIFSSFFIIAVIDDSDRKKELKNKVILLNHVSRNLN